ncbi:DUF423 domain-containing protein [Acidithiobacillus sp. AMEEHan]|uniref:DUF423 domain-containing protein n=1 Tax=Acidithiobacillus sp. AMEEHan TaxID=2994951 RepID=UPI0027E49A89|nr:DUF423 domain-containing protein [Acidithiobacillus sp. AMEEHan]
MQQREEHKKYGSSWAALGALICSLAVILAAAGDHLVAGDVSHHALRIYDIANRFQFFQGIGLILLGLSIAQWGPRASWTWAGILLLLGVLFFSGGLYLVSLIGQSWAFLAPIGGMAMILSWLVFAFALWRSRSG